MGGASTTPKCSTAMLLSLSLGGIAVAALVATVVAMLATETLRGDAAAINLAGSMRMQSYRILTSRLKQDSAIELERQIALYQDKLHDPLLSRMTVGSPDFKAQLGLLKSDWETQLRPAFLNPNMDANNLSAMVEAYVTRIDQSVQSLQRASEKKVRTLYTIQTISLLVLFTLSALLLAAVHKKWINPLRQFMDTVLKLKEGDFSTRVNYPHEDELGLLGETINGMAEQLAELYLDLEQRVEDKTRRLQQSNDSLHLLNEHSSRLFAHPDELYQLVPGVLADIQRLTGLGTIALCLRKEEQGPAFKLLTSDGTRKPSFCQMPHCDRCRSEKDKTVFAPHLKEVALYPVTSGEQHVGDISVELSPGQTIEPWQHSLLSAISEVFATTQGLSKLSHQHSQIALMEERAAIARELHDSLAQSLSFQKMQTGRLRKLLEKNAGDAQLYDAIDQVQEGLNDAYRQLRDLISTFRISVSEPGFEQAIRNAVAQISGRHALEIELDFQIAHCPLSANEETHCLHIVREALSNVGQHAQATKAKVSLQQRPDSLIQIQVEDNGIGIPPQPEKPGHFGLAILSERTSYLHGNLMITRGDPIGTLVDVTFEPTFLNNIIPKPKYATENNSHRISGG